MIDPVNHPFITLGVFAIMWLGAKFVIRILDSKPDQPPTPSDPYRTAATPAPEPPAPKRKFTMPSIRLGKFTKTFGYMMPVCGSAVGVGFIYDAPLLTIGVKWGLAVAIAMVAVFFVGMTLNALNQTQKS